MPAHERGRQKMIKFLDGFADGIAVGLVVAMMIAVATFAPLVLS